MPETIAAIMVFSIPLYAIWASHQRKMLEMRLRGGGAVDQNVAGALNELRREVQELRDTTTRYDISFDAALQRIESRVNHLENRVGTIEQAPNVAQLPR